MPAPTYPFDMTASGVDGQPQTVEAINTVVRHLVCNPRRAYTIIHIGKSADGDTLDPVRVTWSKTSTAAADPTNGTNGPLTGQLTIPGGGGWTFPLGIRDIAILSDSGKVSLSVTPSELQRPVG